MSNRISFGWFFFILMIILLPLTLRENGHTTALRYAVATIVFFYIGSLLSENTALRKQVADLKAANTTPKGPTISNLKAHLILSQPDPAAPSPAAQSPAAAAHTPSV